MKRNRTKPLSTILRLKQVKPVPLITIEEIVKVVHEKNVDLLERFEKAVKSSKPRNH